MKTNHKTFARRHPILSLALVGGLAATTGVELVAAALVGGAMTLLLATPEANELAGSVVDRVRHLRTRATPAHQRST